MFWEEKHGIQTQGTEVLLPSAWSVGADLSRAQGLPSCSDVLLRTWGRGLALWLDAGCSRDDTHSRAPCTSARLHGVHIRFSVSLCPVLLLPHHSHGCGSLINNWYPELYLRMSLKNPTWLFMTLQIIREARLSYGNSWWWVTEEECRNIRIRGRKINYRLLLARDCFVEHTRDPRN